MSRPIPKCEMRFRGQLMRFRTTAILLSKTGPHGANFIKSKSTMRFPIDSY